MAETHEAEAAKKVHFDRCLAQARKEIAAAGDRPNVEILARLTRRIRGDEPLPRQPDARKN